MKKRPKAPNIFAIIAIPLLLILAAPFANAQSVYTERVIHIAFAANNPLYLASAGVAAQSIMDHGAPEYSYSFHVYVTDDLAQNGLAEEDIHPWETLEENYENCTVEIIPVHTIPLEEKINFRHWGKAAVIRLLLPELLPDVNKAIYMDCDMIALKDIAFIDDLSPNMNDTEASLLIQKDVQTFISRKVESFNTSAIAAVVDINHGGQADYICQNFNICDYEEAEYVNSGLLVMDLDALRKESFTERILSWLAKHPEADFPDQTAINIVKKGEINILDLEVAFPVQYEPVSNMSIIHYMASDGKPWKNPETAGALNFIKTMQNSPWFGYIKFPIIVETNQGTPDTEIYKNTKVSTSISSAKLEGIGFLEINWLYYGPYWSLRLLQEAFIHPALIAFE